MDKSSSRKSRRRGRNFYLQDESRNDQADLHVYGDGHKSTTKGREDMGSNCSKTLSQMEQGLLRRRSKAISPTPTLGYCDRPGQRCPKSTRLQDISAHTLRTRKTRRLYSRKPGERIYSTFALPVLITLFLRWEKGREVPTGGRLQEAKFVHSARSIPPSPYPGISG